MFRYGRTRQNRQENVFPVFFFLGGIEHHHVVHFGRLSVAVIEGGERELEGPRQFEVHGIVALQVIASRKFHHAARGEKIQGFP